MKKIGFILLIVLVCKSLLSQQQDSVKWNFGITVKLGTTNIYPKQGDYRKNYPGIYPLYGRNNLFSTPPSKIGYIGYHNSKKFAYALGFSVQYNFSLSSAVEIGLIINTKNYFYPTYHSGNYFGQAQDYWLFDSYYLDIPISYQYHFNIGKRSKIRISAGVTGCIFLFGDQTNEFFLDMYDKAVVIHRGNYRPVAMMINGALEYVFPFFNNHIAVGPTFQIAPMSFTRKENTISSPNRYGGQTFEVSKHYEFKPYFIGVGLTYYLR